LFSIWLLINSSCSSDVTASQKPLGHSDANDLTLNPKLQPQSEQHGCVPGATQSLPCASKSEHFIHIWYLAVAIASTC